MEIFKLFGSILVDNAAANQSISKTEEKAEGLGKKFLSGSRNSGKMGDSNRRSSTRRSGGVRGYRDESRGDNRSD